MVVLKELYDIQISVLEKVLRDEADLLEVLPGN
jgi:hypothetical protein